MADRLLYSHSPRSTFGSRGALVASAMVETHGSEGLEWFVLGPDGEELGPFNFRVVRAKLRIGVFAADSYVWREGMDDWGLAKDERLFASCIGYQPFVNENGNGGDILDGHGNDNTSTTASRMTATAPRTNGFDDHGLADAGMPTTDIVKKELRFSTNGHATANANGNASTPMASTSRKANISNGRGADAGDNGGIGGGETDVNDWYFISRELREEEGPCSRDELQMLFDNGDIDGTTWVWNYRKQPEWAMIMNVSALQSIFKARPTSDIDTEGNRFGRENARAPTDSVRREFMTRQALEGGDDDDDDDDYADADGGGDGDNLRSAENAFLKMALEKGKQRIGDTSTGLSSGTGSGRANGATSQSDGSRGTAGSAHRVGMTSTPGNAPSGTGLPKRFENLPSAMRASRQDANAGTEGRARTDMDTISRSMQAAHSKMPPPPPAGHSFAGSPLRPTLNEVERLSGELRQLELRYASKRVKCKRYKSRTRVLIGELEMKDKQIEVLKRMVKKAREVPAATSASRGEASDATLGAEGRRHQQDQGQDNANSHSMENAGISTEDIDVAAVNTTLEAQRDEIQLLRKTLSERETELHRVRESFSSNLSWFLNGVDEGQTLDLMRSDSLLLDALKNVADSED